jgi:hypothetical protein
LSALLALSAASCDGPPAMLEANVRAAAAPRAEPAPPQAAAAAGAGTRAEPIADLLAAAATGREGDGLPARLEAVLQRDDASVGPAVTFIHAGKATRLIIDALAAAGTPAAQAALCGLARDARLPTPVRAEAVASLGLVKRPTPSTMTEVGALVRTGDPDLSAPALFLAGSVARAGRAEQPSQAVAIEKLVLAATARARGTDELLAALAALGNLGSPTVLPRLRAAATAGDPRIRAAATRALRLVPDAEADRLLAATLGRDQDATVRAAAIFAAGFRKLDPLADALAATAETDRIDYVRAGAVTLLARNREISPRIARALAYVASNDPKPDLRRLAAGAADR